MSDRKTVPATWGAMLIPAGLVIISGLVTTASASVPLELAVHEAARAARRQKFDELLVVVRESYRSNRDQDIAGVLRAVEKMAIDALEKEPGVKGTADREVREVAQKRKARVAMRTSEVRQFQQLEEADAVLSVDYRNRAGIVLQLSLLDEKGVYFSEEVRLKVKPEPASEYLKETSSETSSSSQSANAQASSAAGAGTTTSGGVRTGMIALAPGSETVRGTGGRCMRSSRDRIVRSQSEAQRAREAERAEKSEEDGESDSESDAEQTGTPRTPSGPISQLQREIVNFAADNIGRKVGRGECWDLADQAMRAAGAEPPKGYTYGNQIPLSEIQPGDILQFTSARFDEPGYWTIMGMPNHTAVVHAVGDTRTFILQQNFDGKRYVTTYDLNINNLTSGKLEAWRPVPAGQR